MDLWRGINEKDSEKRAAIPWLNSDKELNHLSTVS